MSRRAALVAFFLLGVGLGPDAGVSATVPVHSSKVVAVVPVVKARVPDGSSYSRLKRDQPLWEFSVTGQLWNVGCKTDVPPVCASPHNSVSQTGRRTHLSRPWALCLAAIILGLFWRAQLVSYSRP